MYFGILGVFCTINWYFEYRIRIRCTFLYMGTYFKDLSEHFFFSNNFQTCPRSANIFGTNYSFLEFWGFLVLNGPLTSLKHLWPLHGAMGPEKRWPASPACRNGREHPLWPLDGAMGPELQISKQIN